MDKLANSGDLDPMEGSPILSNKAKKGRVQRHHFRRDGPLKVCNTSISSNRFNIGSVVEQSDVIVFVATHIRGPGFLPMTRQCSDTLCSGREETL